MENGIGELLFQMRTEAGLSQGQVCHHLCSVPQYARLEANQITIDVFLLDRIFGRMGKPTERLEYVLPREIYEIYELRYLIQRAVCHRDYEGALDLLGKYEAMKISEKPLHTQFIEQEKAQIEWLRSKDVDVTLAHVENALRQTVEYEEFTELLQHENTYSVEELKLLLFRWDICFQTEYQRTDKELLALLKCCNQDKYVDVEQVKVFPYAVCLWARICNWEKELEQLEAYVKKSVSLLENTGKVLFLSEILTLYKDILCYQQKEDTLFFRKLEKQIQCLEDSENEFGVILRDFVLFSHMNRRFDVDSEIIQRTRTLRKMSQETLCEDICTQEELSRVETGKRKLRDKNLNAFMERLNRPQKRVNMIISSRQYKVYELKRSYFNELSLFHFEEAQKVYDEIAEMLDSSIPENRQFLVGEKAKLDYELSKLDWKECLEKLNTALRMTLDVEIEEIGKIHLSAEEHCILNEIAIILYEHKREEESVKILEKQISSLQSEYVLPVFHLMEWQVAVSNLSIICEEMGRPKQAILTCKGKTQMELEAGKGNRIGCTFITEASAMEQLDNDDCVIYYKKGIDWLKLYHQTWRYENVKKYLSSEECKYRGVFNDLLD